MQLGREVDKLGAEAKDAHHQVAVAVRVVLRGAELLLGQKVERKLHSALCKVAAHQVGQPLDPLLALDQAGVALLDVADAAGIVGIVDRREGAEQLREGRLRAAGARLPEPKDADIRITLGEMSDKLSEDEVYQRTLRQMGILRWDIEVPAKAEGASARKVEYEFKMEFDRNMHISEPSAAEVEAKRLEFEEMLMSQ